MMPIGFEATVVTMIGVLLLIVARHGLTSAALKGWRGYDITVYKVAVGQGCADATVQLLSDRFLAILFFLQANPRFLASALLGDLQKFCGYLDR